MDRTIGSACDITTGKLDANQAVECGQYPFFTCAEYPDTIDHYAYDNDVVLVAGNNARGNFHVSRFRGKFNAYQRTYILTAKSGCNIDYVYYVLKLELKRLRERSQGSQTKFLTMPLLTGVHLRDLNFDEQTIIADVLSTIDKKIELNNRINTELEAMAKSLYDYWFVQFDFPDAKGKPYKTAGGKMVYNTTLKREIPEGWTDTTVESVLAKVPNTKKIPNKEILNTGVLPVIDQSMDYICGFTNETDSLLEVCEPHIIFGDHTRIVKFINFNYARGADGTQLLISNKKELPAHLLFQMVKDIDLSNYGYARHFKFLKDSKIIVPDVGTSLKFEVLATSFYRRIKAGIFENMELENIRDWLLPMLMNGQVTVK